MKHAHWPTRKELDILQQQENERAKMFDEEADPICECGEVGWACRCESIAYDLGYYADGSEYHA
jgi:hypothetical protein